MIKKDLELNEKTKKEIEKAKKRVRSGKFLTHNQVKEKLGLYLLIF